MKKRTTSQSHSPMHVASLAELARVRGGSPSAERQSANTASTAMPPITLGEAALQGVYKEMLKDV